MGVLGFMGEQGRSTLERRCAALNAWGLGATGRSPAAHAPVTWVAQGLQAVLAQDTRELPRKSDEQVVPADP